MCSRCVMSYYGVFFLKQKTAYEMRISDWSSDLCSSDLHCRAGGGGGTPPVSSPPICPRSCPVLLRSLHREFSMRYVFVALLFAAVPGLAFAQPLTFEDALSRAEAAPSVQARSLDVEARRSAAIAAGRLPDPKLGVGLDNFPVSGPDRKSTRL